MHPAKGDQLTVCQRCGAWTDGHKWHLEQPRLEKRLKKKESVHQGTCPGCDRIEKRRIDGIVILQGDFLLRHHDDAINLIHNIAEKRRKKNINARIFELDETEQEIKVKATDRHLAESIGKEFEKAFRGHLDIRWLKKEEFVRVAWRREDLGKEHM